MKATEEFLKATKPRKGKEIKFKFSDLRQGCPGGKDSEAFTLNDTLRDIAGGLSRQNWGAGHE